MAVLEWDETTQKLVYETSFVFHPTIKLNQKSDAIALLDHQYHLKRFYVDRKTAGKPISSTGIEDRSFNSFGQAATRGEVWGVYSTLAVLNSDLIVISPLKLKKFATGDGHAEKEDVMDYVIKQYGLSDKLKGKGKNKFTFDESDAIVLAEVGFWAWKIMHEGEVAGAKLTDYQKEVLLEKEPNRSGKRKKKTKSSGICHREDDFYIYKIQEKKNGKE